MQYTVIVHESPGCFALRADPDAQKRADYWGAIAGYLRALRAAGVFVGGAGLEPPQTAATFHLRDGKLVQDGPFPDTREQLGGFFILEVPDRQAALTWAGRCPAAPGRVVEVRANLPPLPME